MKRLWLIGLIVIVLGLLVAGFAVPTFAHDPGGGAWEEMHQACESGDYEAMAEWHALCYGEGGVMSGSMMGGGMMRRGMMGRGMMGGMH